MTLVALTLFKKTNGVIIIEISPRVGSLECYKALSQSDKNNQIWFFLWYNHSSFKFTKLSNSIPLFKAKTLYILPWTAFIWNLSKNYHHFDTHNSQFLRQRVDASGQCIDFARTINFFINIHRASNEALMWYHCVDTREMITFIIHFRNSILFF